MGSRLHGNDEGWRAPTVIPAKGDLCITVVPAQAGIQGGVRGMGRERRGAAAETRTHS